MCRFENLNIFVFSPLFDPPKGRVALGSKFSDAQFYYGSWSFIFWLMQVKNFYGLTPLTCADLKTSTYLYFHPYLTLPRAGLHLGQNFLMHNFTLGHGLSYFG